MEKEKILNFIDELIERQRELRNKVSSSGARGRHNDVINELGKVFEYVESI